MALNWFSVEELEEIKPQVLNFINNNNDVYEAFLNLKNDEHDLIKYFYYQFAPVLEIYEVLLITNADIEYTVKENTIDVSFEIKLKLKT